MGATRLRLLNQNDQIRNAGNRNDTGREKFPLYHVHYFDDLNAEGASRQLDWHCDLIKRWIDDIPVLAANGWEPYPLSLRIVNWIKWHLREDALSERALANLYIQAKALNQCVEPHKQGIRNLANAKGLCFAGHFFSSNEADRWKRRGQDILREQLDEQVLEDGGHFDLSPMYHAIILEDVLDLINLFRSYGDNSVASLKPVASDMLRWLQVMTHPDDLLSYFNDSTAGAAATYSSLRDYADRLDVECPEVSLSGITALRDSGYVRYDDSSLAIIIDAGKIDPDNRPGHGHCDCLSFELSFQGKRALVNTGISTYTANGRRMHERSTSAHNTVSIESAEQSDIWRSFRMRHCPFPLDVWVNEQSVQAAHGGFSVVGVTHRREFFFGKAKLKIIDHVGRDDADVFRGTAHFHFHPSVNINVSDDHVDFAGMAMKFLNHKSIVVSDYEYCQGFCNTVTGKVVSAEFASRLVTEIEY